MTSLTLETVWMLPLALGITLWQQIGGGSDLGSLSLSEYSLYILTAPVTYAPLLLFAAAIKRTSLTVVGLAQYVEPSLQFLLAVPFGEPINLPKMISFSLIWLGLALCIYELFRRPHRRSAAHQDGAATERATPLCAAQRNPEPFILPFAPGNPARSLSATPTIPHQIGMAAIERIHDVISSTFYRLIV
ncbi:hypothetical protein O0544_00030 [Edwardsiella anguillarum]|nr:hypothetical protein [Edwardsiella anguillarum]